MKRYLAVHAILVCALAGCAKTSLENPPATPCASVFCSDHGACVESSGAAQCLCDPGFAADGLECVPSDPCQPNPCAEPHRTRCRASGSAAICLCDEGYWDEGECVPAVSCEPNPCTGAHKGVCGIEAGEVACSCDEGFRDDGQGTCVPSDPCEPNPCSDPHRARCKAMGAVAVCSCDEGYWDVGECVPAVSCEPSPCSGAHKTTCTLEGTEARCSCDPGYVEDAGGGCVPFDPCQPNPCTDSHRTKCKATSGVAVCSCDEGYWEMGECVPAVSCTPNPCSGAHKTTCTLAGTEATCSCDPGYVEDASGGCVPFDPCQPNPCSDAHRTKCKAVGGAAVCSCDEGFWDHGECVPAASCTPNPCVGLHKTVCSLGGQGVLCSCESGYEDDGAGGCRVDDPCAPNPCAEPNRTSCSASGFVALCSCNPGYRDDGAGRCVAADPCTPNPCVEPNRSVCKAAGSIAVCACDAGHRDDGTGRCILADPCSPNPCTEANRAVCTASGTSARCGCNPGYRDNGLGACVQACSPNPCTAPHQSVCAAAPAGYQCGCDPGYTPAAGGGCTVAAPAGCTGVHDTGDAYEPDECPALARVVTLPAAAEAHTLDRAGDQDWLAVQVAAGKTVVVTVTGGSYSPGVEVTIFDSTGTQVLATYASTSSATVTATPAEASVLVRVRSYNGQSTGSYTLSVKEVADDHANTASSGTALTAGVRTSGALEYTADLDWFAFAATAAHVYRVTFTVTGSAACYLFDEGAATSGSSSYLAYGYTYSSGTVTLGYQAAVTGTYYLRVQPYSGLATPTYSVLVEDLGLEDHGDVYTASTTVTPGVAASGVLGFSGDKDWFSFNAVPGHIYEVKATAGGSVNLTLFNTNATSSLAYDYGSVASVAAKLLGTGPYYARVQPDYSSTPIAYTLEINDLGLDDFGDSAAEATPLTVGSAMSGKVHYPSDKDWFSLATVPGRLYKAELTGATNARLVLYGANGTTELQSASGGSVVALNFGALDGGPYYLSVGNYWSDGAPFPYTLTVTETGTDDHGNAATMATPLTLGEVSYGVLEYAGDKDYFSVALVAQRVYRFDVVPSGFTANVTLYLGTAVLANSTALFQMRASTTGTYHLAVASTYSSSVGGAYSVLVTDLGPDDHGDVATSATPLSVGVGTSGSVQFSGDVDFLSLATTANRIYRVTVKPLGFSAKSRLLSTDGVTELATQSNYAPAVFTFLASTTGRYFVSVASQYTGGVGSFTVLAEDIGTDDAGNSAAAASPLVVGAAAVTGSVQYLGDVDVYSFTAVPGELALDVTVQGPLATSWRLGGASGSPIATGSGPGTTKVTLPSEGLWYLTIAPATAGQIGQYSVAVAP
ncbi:MAG TPA: PPC domain-containing protein [Myxococcales bacterium]|jgi:hypothetical protein